MKHMKAKHPEQCRQFYRLLIDRTRKINSLTDTEEMNNNEGLKNVNASSPEVDFYYFCKDCIFWCKRKHLLVKHQLKVHSISSKKMLPEEPEEDDNVAAMGPGTTTNSVMEEGQLNECLAKNDAAASVVNAQCKEVEFMTRPKEDFSRHLNSSKPENEGLKVNLTRFYCRLCALDFDLKFKLNRHLSRIHKAKNNGDEAGSDEDEDENLITFACQSCDHDAFCTTKPDEMIKHHLERHHQEEEELSSFWHASSESDAALHAC